LQGKHLFEEYGITTNYIKAET